MEIEAESGEKMMSKALRIIQVGVGFWGWSWVNVALESPSWELVGLVDLKRENLKKACDFYKFKQENTFTSIDAAVEAVKPDAALIVVGAEAHAKVTIDALKQGLHCLVEKPIAPTMKEARTMVDTALKVGRKLMVSQNYRFKRVPRTIKQFLNTGMMGEVGSVFVNFQKAPHFTGFRIEMDEPLITDMSIHHFDQMRYLTGLEPVGVLAHSWNPKWSRFKGNPVATVIFEMENGAVITYTGSWTSQGWKTTWDGEWCIRGDGGEIRWRENEISFRVTNLLHEVYTKGALETHEGAIRLELVDMPAEDRWASLLEFAGAVTEDREPETSGRNNLYTLAMVLGACKSIKLKQPVYIKDVLEEE